MSYDRPKRPEKSVQETLNEQEIDERLDEIEQEVADSVQAMSSKIGDALFEIRNQRSEKETKEAIKEAERSIKDAKKMIEKYEKAVNASPLNEEDKDNRFDLLSIDKHSFNESKRKLDESLGKVKVHRPSQAPQKQSIFQTRDAFMSPDRPKRPEKNLQETLNEQEIDARLDEIEETTTDAVQALFSVVSEAISEIQNPSSEKAAKEALKEAERSIKDAKKMIEKYEKAVNASALSEEDKFNRLDILSIDKQSFNENKRKLDESLGKAKVYRPSQAAPPKPQQATPTTPGRPASQAPSLFNKPTQSQNKTSTPTAPARPTSGYKK
jgi:tetrahydromethanopterin S-methyltransferase subunit G